MVVTSRTLLSEQSCSEDDTIVSFVVSSAHLTGPFCVFLHFLNDTTCIVFSASAGVNALVDISVVRSSSGRKNIWTKTLFIVLPLSVQ